MTKEEHNCDNVKCNHNNTKGLCCLHNPENCKYRQLQKENAELKEEISTKDILIKELQEQKEYWKESSFDWRHKFFKKGSTKRLVQKDKQLTKAKDYILKLTTYLEGHTNFDFEYELIKEVKQFLSEVKK